MEKLPTLKGKIHFQWILEKPDGDELCSEVWADSKTQKVTVKNYTDYFLCKVFGNNENPTIHDLDLLMERRSVPRNRQEMEISLHIYGVSQYDTYEIAKKIEGRSYADPFYMRFLP